MKNKHLHFSLNAASLLFAVWIATPAMADVCNNVTFFAHNPDPTDDIRIYRVRYHDLNSGNPNTFHTENVDNITCVHGNTCATDPQDLGGVGSPRENHDLTDIEFEFAFRQSDGTGWGARNWSSPNTPTDLNCTDNRNYGDNPANPFDVN
jgi:hypothetical protein